MKKITFKNFILILLCVPNFLLAQEKNKTAKKIFNQELTIDNQESIGKTGFVRCATTEYERSLQEKFPKRISTEAFENWLTPKMEEVSTLLESSRRAIITIPVVFHVITDGSPGGENLSQAAIQAQIDQLNIDFANLDSSPHAVAVDTEIRFCLALQDPEGQNMLEPGINRFTDYADPYYFPSEMEAVIKPATQWDPTRYMNVWTVNLGGGILGYAQFPDPTGSGLSGLEEEDIGSIGSANTDGIVVKADTVGSEANPNPLGGNYYASGRTLSHEVGHWLGLRHIWGDGDCSVDDYCADTPNADGANYSCSWTNSCPEGDYDMIENYMDYTRDTCMNTFTADQKTRILAIMANAPRRMELTTSNVCSLGIIYDLDGRVDINDLNIIDDCSNPTMTPNVRLTNWGTNTLTTATISYYIDSETPVTYNWSGSLNINEFENISLPELATTVGAQTFYVELSEPNGGTDLNTVNDNASKSHTYTGGRCVSVGNELDGILTRTTGVVFNTISNLDNNPYGDNGYSDFTVLTTDLARAESYDLTVNIDTDGESRTCNTRVWIDWNQNCIFDDEEEYDLGGGTGLVNQPTSNSPLSITIPTDAVLGKTIMRITTRNGAPPGPCQNNYNAEIEDYSVNVTDVLSIDEFALNSIRLYPNPTTGVLNIALSNGNDLPDGYKIYNMLGQLLSQKVISTVSDLSINTSDLSVGMYFIQITKEGNFVSLPFIKK